jgi:hypothetical protein
VAKKKRITKSEWGPSRACQEGLHEWCMNMDTDETHCTCKCHNHGKSKRKP